MEYQRRVIQLVVLALLQLCRAEIKDTQPQWYSANIINDGFQPKSISEIFSTEPSFSTASPIIVSSEFDSSYPDGDVSTLAPSSFGTKTTGFSHPSTFTQSNSELVSPLQTQYMTHMTTPAQKTSPYMEQTSVEIPQKTTATDLENTRPLFVSELPTQPQRNVQIQQSTPTTWTFHPSSTVTETPTIFQTPVTESTLSGEISYEYPQTQSTPKPKQMTLGRQQALHIPPNYFLIYQQAPQSFPSLYSPEIKYLPPPQMTSQDSFTTQSPMSSTVPLTQSYTFSSTIPSTMSSSSSTFSSTTPTTLRTSPVLISSTTAPVTQQSSSTIASTPKVTVTTTSTIGSSISSSSRNTRTSVGPNCRFSTTPMPSSISVKHSPIDSILFPLKIRVLAPSGSITNVNINPVNKLPLTTKKPTTTTRRPTTRRTPRPKKNTYDGCLHGCRKHGQNLCAAPLGQNPINPDTLRGFPSVCHMACYNSYKKISYEKIIDGSCGKLRTRIRPIDSNSKLKKDELHKVQYILDNPGQKAIVEFTGHYT